MATADISGCEPKRSRVIDNDFDGSFGSRQFNTATKPPTPRTGSKPLSFKTVKEHSLQNEEELIPGSQPQPREVTPTRDYTIMVVQENEEVDWRERVARKVLKHVEDFVNSDSTSDPEFLIYTVPTSSTPKLSRIYNNAFDGVVPSKGIAGPTVVRTDKTSKSSVTRNLEEIDYLGLQF